MNYVQSVAEEQSIVWLKCCRHFIRKTSSINRTKSQNLNVSCLLLQWPLYNPLKPGVKLRMKMELEQRRQYNTSATTRNRFWAGTVLHWSAYTWHWRKYIISYEGDTISCFPCTGSRVNTNYERIATWGGCQWRTVYPRLLKTPLAAHCCI